MANALSRPDVSGVSEAWLRGIPHDPDDADWSVYDTYIVLTVRAYNDHLALQQNFLPLDPVFVKAICWTETGAGEPTWNTRPMQIGNAGDLGLQQLLKLNIQNRLLIPPEFSRGGKFEFTVSNVRAIPAFNIRAGVGYLLLRASTLLQKYVPADNGQIFTDTVRKPDSLYNMAHRDRTTVEELRSANPPGLTRSLNPKTTLSFRHMELQSSLIFRPITSLQAASTYNNANVDEYTKKLNYCLWVLHGGARAADSAAAAAKGSNK